MPPLPMPPPPPEPVGGEEDEGGDGEGGDGEGGDGEGGGDGDGGDGKEGSGGGGDGGGGGDVAAPASKVEEGAGDATPSLSRACVVDAVEVTEAVSRKVGAAWCDVCVVAVLQQQCWPADVLTCWCAACRVLRVVCCVLCAVGAATVRTALQQ